MYVVHIRVHARTHAQMLTHFNADVMARTSLSPIMTLVNGQRYFDDVPRPLAMTLHTFNTLEPAPSHNISEVGRGT